MRIRMATPWQSNSLRSVGLVLMLMVASCRAMTPATSATDQAHEQVTGIVVQIQRADYEGDRAALKQLHAGLAPFVHNQKLAARVLYWRGFALWRRAINGYNDKADAADLQNDLQQALDEFDEATRIEPAFVDAKVGALSCTGLLAYSFPQQDTSTAKTTELIARSRALRKEIETEAPQNPRFLWVEGPIFWNVPARYGGDSRRPSRRMKGHRLNPEPQDQGSGFARSNLGRARVVDEPCLVQTQSNNAQRKCRGVGREFSAQVGSLLALRPVHSAATNPRS